MIDEKDMKIIEALRKNSKKTFFELAKEVGLTHITVMKRLKKLKEKGIIRNFTVDVDWKKLGYNLNVLIEIHLEKITDNSTKMVKEILENCPNVEQVFDVVGGSDIMAIARFKDHEELSSFLIEKVLSNEHVRRTETKFIF